MSDAKAEEITTVTNDGITVEKSFEPGDFPVPAIAFTLKSDRDEAVSVRLVDSVPEDVSPENVGFHPKYGAEFWNVDGDLIVFEREFAPNEEYTTVYGLRGSDADEAEKFMSEPTIESVDPPLESSGEETDEAASPSEGQIDSESDLDIEPDLDTEEGVNTPSDLVAEPLEDESGFPENDVDTDSTVTPDEGGAEDSVRIERETSNEPDDNADETTPKESESADIDDDELGTETTSGDKNDNSEPVSAGSLLDSLASEIEAADPDDAELVALRDALGMNLTRKSVEARIEHVQSTVADLDAYTDALEEFLDENGDAQSLLEDLRSDYDDTTDRLDEIETKADANGEAIVELESELESKLETRLADVEDEIGGLETRLESIEDELSEVVEMRNRLASALGGLGTAPDEELSDDEE